uniref:Protein piccolo n=1 Tax=Zeugodacus cucurbitae TaxID=28588 RepID=A0A0A1XGE5_ZEUCU
MSWRVRHFLKQARENKGDECNKILAQNKDIFNGTGQSTIDEQSDTLYGSPKHKETENNKPLTTPVEAKETKDFNILSPLSTSLESRFSPFTSPKGRYINWTTKHSELTTQPWCCISDVINFCDKHEYQTLQFSDPNVKNKIVFEVKALLAGGIAPFDICKRFPDNIRKPEDLWICISRCASVEYHLQQMLSLFRRSLAHLLADKLRVLKQNFRLAVNELRLDISAHISSVNLYDRNIFEHEFQLRWEDTVD